MRTLFEHIDRVKEKPHATRRQIALASAFGLSALVALIWFVGVVSTGTFAIQGSSFAESVGSESRVVTSSSPNNSDLLGAASAAFGAKPDTAHIEIVSTATSSTKSAKKPEQTVIPF